MKPLISCRSVIVFVITLAILPVFAANISAKYYPDNTGNVYVHKSTEDKKIALTFDDGPHPSKTEQILNVLKKYKVKGTFFTIGQNAERYPEILQKIMAEGHEIANHTYDHKSIYKLSEREIQLSVQKCSKIIREITGVEPKLFRPPEGFMNDNIARFMDQDGYNVILWKIDTYDWKGRSAEDIYQTVVSKIHCGDIILMHDYIWRKSNTPEALDLIIPRLLSEGYEFLCVSELLAS